MYGYKGPERTPYHATLPIPPDKAVKGVWKQQNRWLVEDLGLGYESLVGENGEGEKIAKGGVKTCDGVGDTWCLSVQVIQHV